MGGITDALRLSAACSFGMQPVNLLLSFHGIDNFTGLVEFLPAALVNLWRLPHHGDARQRLVTAGLALWSVRLGAFLLRRMVARSASDARLDELRRRGPLALAGFWLVHGSWGLVVSLPCTLGCASAPGPARARDVAGFGLWLAGFALESVGDARKARFRERRGADRYFDVGGDPLWTWSRYPHLAGETFCWLGLAVVAGGWAFLSPAMTLLLRATRRPRSPPTRRRGCSAETSAAGCGSRGGSSRSPWAARLGSLKNEVFKCSCPPARRWQL